MAVDFADIDRDGDYEFMVVDMLSQNHQLRLQQRINHELRHFPWWGFPLDMSRIDAVPQVMRNTLFLNQGDSSFIEMARFSGVDASEWSWGIIFLDVDLDGYEDILIANGHGHNLSDSDLNNQKNASAPDMGMNSAASIRGLPRLNAANVAFHNLKNNRFADRSNEWNFNHYGISNGMALADLDGDGDQDVVINNLHEKPCLLENLATGPRIKVSIATQSMNTAGIGAKIILKGRNFSQSQEIISGGRYLSSDAPARTCALPDETHTLIVKWPDGSETTIPDPQANCHYIVHHGVRILPAHPSSTGQKSDQQPIFRDVSDQLKHNHQESWIEVAGGQPGLPRFPLPYGPAVALFDLNGDGTDDLMTGSGTGHPTRFYLARPGGGFGLVNSPAFQKAGIGEPLALMALNMGTATEIIQYFSNLRSQGRPDGQLAHWSASPFGIQQLPDISQLGGGPIAAGDLDGDGDLDLVLASLPLANQYPKTSGLQFLIHDRGNWIPMPGSALGIEPMIGVTTGMVWVDADLDGDPDLVTCMEPGSLRYYQNTGGRFVDKSAGSGLAQYSGLWSGITAADFNGDGFIDFAASNRGLNSDYQRHITHGIQLFIADLNGDGKIEFIESIENPESGVRVPFRDLFTLSRSMPEWMVRFPTYGKFAATDIHTILDPYAASLSPDYPEPTLTLNTLAASLFLSQGTDVWSAQPLPDAAQLGWSGALVTTDFNGDGILDIFLAQNHFGLDRESGRDNEGSGLLLLGRDPTDVSFQAVDASISGIRLYGHMSSVAIGDLDGNSLPDLVIGQQNHRAGIFLNQSPSEYISLDLRDSRNASPLAIASMARLGGEGQQWQLVTAGNGNLAQNSHKLFFPNKRDARTKLDIRWPDGSAHQVHTSNPSNRQLTIDKSKLPPPSPNPIHE